MQALNSNLLAFLIVHSGRVLLVALVVSFSTKTNSATITWDAGGDGVSTYAEANWTDIDDVAGTNPPANTVNPSPFAIAVDMIVGGSSTAGGPTGAGGTVRLADAVTLTVRDDATFRMQAGGAIDNLDPAVNANISIEDNAGVFAQFLANISTEMSGSSSLVLFGGGDPLGANVIINLATDWIGFIRFNNETVADASAEHLSQITVGGAPAVLGTNVEIVSNGGAGSILTVIVVPEPASMMLVLSSLVHCAWWRRR